jgi:hypothetical protein
MYTSVKYVGLEFWELSSLDPCHGLFIPSGSVYSKRVCLSQVGLFIPSGSVYPKWVCLSQVGLFIPSGSVYSKWVCLFQVGLFIPSGFCQCFLQSFITIFGTVP